MDFEREFRKSSELNIPDEVFKHINENNLLKVPEFFYTHLKLLILDNGLKKLTSLIKMYVEKECLPVAIISYVLRPFQKCVEYLKPTFLVSYSDLFMEILDKLIKVDIDSIPLSEKKKVFRVYDIIETVMLQLWVTEVFFFMRFFLVYFVFRSFLMYFIYSLSL
jgi:hypothetical protein